jgi:MFS family permease
MATGAIASLVFGRLLDKLGFKVFLFAFILSSFFAPLVFSNSMILTIIGTILWGIGLGSQDSLFKAELNKMVPYNKRSSGFGIFDTGFGIGWFIGSVIMGWLYDHTISTLVFFSVVSMLASIPIFITANKLN